MISIIFYFIYFVLLSFAFIPFFKSKRYLHLSLLPILFFPHFNATVFFKMGLTISFFELYVIIIFLMICACKTPMPFKLGKIDVFFSYFVIFAFISIAIANIRVLFDNLEPSKHFPIPPLVRSLMSLNRFLIYPFLLIYIRNFFEKSSVNINLYFKKYLAYSGVLPSFATILQSMNIGFKLLLNNPSFNMNLGWVNIDRPLGLTNEASFFSYMIFFSILGVFYAYKDNIISRKLCVFLYLLYITSIILSISRTGLVVVFLFFAIKYYNKLTISRLLLFLSVVVLLSYLNIGGFNILNRLSSSFVLESDLSTIERYGSTEALLRLVFDKSLFFGVGIFNYTFYIYSYLPAYLYNTIPYSLNYQIPSFNFIIQLIAEFGLVLCLLFFSSVYRVLKSINNSFVNDWFFYLFIFSLSFQTINFSLPFVIIVFSLKQLNNIVYDT